MRPIWDFDTEGGFAMNPEIRATNMALTQLSKQIDELYHRYGAYCGLSDPAIWVLYSLYEDEEKTYTQNDLVSMWFYPKQTVNYTVNSLVKNGWIYLEQLAGGRNRKAIHLTQQGEEICRERILPLMLAEERSLARMSKEEQILLLQLTEKQLANFEEEIERIVSCKEKESC